MALENIKVNNQQVIGVDSELTYNSNNFVKSGSVYSSANVTELTFNINGFVDGRGITTTTDAWKNTGLIPVFPESRIYGRLYLALSEYLLNTCLYFAFYDKQKNFLSGTIPEATGMSDVSYIVPTTAYYVKVSTKTTFVNQSYVKIVQRKQENESIRGLIDILSCVFEAGYIDTDGVKHNASINSWSCTDYIEVTEGMKYEAYVSGKVDVTLLLAFYDKKKIFKSSINPTVDEEPVQVKGEIPSGICYVRASNRTNLINPNPYMYIKVDINTKILQLESLTVGKTKYKYHHNLHKPYSFSSKTVAFFGDSVTYGIYSDSNGIHPAINNCYRSHLCDILNMDNSNANFAISGSCICDPENDRSILNKVLSEITASSNYGFVFIAGGVNDFSTGKPVGTLSDTTNTTFYGSLTVMCNHLKTVLSGKATEVFFITPMNWSRLGLYNDIAELNDYRNAIFEVATMNGFSVIDGSQIGFPDEKELTLYKSTMIYDGVHPTIAGHMMMALNIASIIL